MKKKKNYQNILYFNSYFKNILKVSQNINLPIFFEIQDLLEEKIKKNKTIFVAGNGGSAAISNHFMCDFNKGIKISSKYKLKPKIISLSTSLELITAISNDLSYDEIFKFQLENYYNKGDCLICFSCSGQSKNIINVIKFANKKKIKTVLFQGFGKLNNKIKPDFYINLNFRNYGLTEDLFQNFMHIISQLIRKKYFNNTVL
jgi:D-sedoheptulose 7-phosphate isomerase